MAKKILFIITQSRVGGAQRFIYRLVSNLDLQKYNITVAAGPEGNDVNGLLFALKKDGIKIVSLKFLRRAINLWLDFRGLLEIYKLIKKNKPDIVFVNSTKAGILGSIAARIAKTKKIIYRIGGWTFGDPWSKQKKRLYIFLEKLTAKFKDIIINNAESDRQQAIKIGIKPKDKIVTIYNGIDEKELKLLSREKARNYLKIKGSDFVVGTIAGFYPSKGLSYLVEAARLLKNMQIRFMIIGGGQETIKLEIKNLIKRHGLENSFSLVKPTFEDYKYLKAFDIFVLPSVKEGFPWTILEAMVSGVPIIATKVGAIPEIIEHKKTGLLVEPGNAKELSKAISELINNRSLGVKFSNQAKKVVEKKFTLDKMVREIEKLL